MSSSSSTDVFQFGERLGIFITALAALLSAISALGLLIYTTIRQLKRWKSPRYRVRNSSHLDASGFSLLVSLIFADFIQALGGTPYWKWMLDGKVTEGSLCTFQGVFLNVANIAIAFSSLSIAVHTFIVFVLHWKVTRFVLRVVVACIWVLAAIIVVACGRGRRGYYGNTGYWCWISEHHDVERIVGEYLWMWIAFFVMIGLYASLFIMMLRGTSIEAHGGFDQGPTSEEEEEELREARKMAYSMLYFPAVYLVCLAPVSISRWLAWSRPQSQLPAAATLFSNTVFSLSGFLNLILFYITRPRLITGSTDSLTSRDGQRISISEDEPKADHTQHPSSNSASRVEDSWGRRTNVGVDSASVPQVADSERPALRSYSPAPSPHVPRGLDLRMQSEGRLPD